MSFPRSSSKKLPDHWRTFGQRRTNNPASGRRAILGILHSHKYARDSFALDLMEAARPDVDSYVLGLLESHVFTPQDFHDTRTAACRIATPLAHNLSQTAPNWRDYLAEPTEEAVRSLSRTPGVRVTNVTTPLTPVEPQHCRQVDWPSAFPSD
jgi:CRISPR-associated protein Cas1